MGKLLTCGRRMGMAALILAMGVYGAADLAQAQKRTPEQGPDDAAKALQQLLDGGLTDAPAGRQAPDGAKALEGLMKGLTASAEAKGETEIAQACLLPLLMPSLSGKAGSPEEQAKAGELEGYATSLYQTLVKKRWEEALGIAQKGLDLEREIKAWPLAAPRELYRGEMWSARGAAYYARTEGGKIANIENAIEAHKNAAEAYRQGLKAGTLNKECTHVLAAIQSNLGIAYSQRIRGEKAENLELGLAAFEEALKTLTQETAPQLWAGTQMNLGSAYISRIRGKRAENMERGIAAFEAALRVWTLEDFPGAWAAVQNNLSSAYLTRVRGNRADNAERALEASANSLKVRTRELPSGEKPIPAPLANLQKDSLKNLDDAGLGDFGKALSDVVEATVSAEAQGNRAVVALRPDGFAPSQHNLASAYFLRIKGGRADNLERAIAAYEAALTLWTREAYPVEWAMVQANLGEALINRQRGNRAENLGRAIGVLRAALEVSTSRAFPRDNLFAARLLGQALAAKGDWKGALEAFDGARTSFRLLFGQGLNEAEARDVLKEAGPLFTEAAYAAAELGDGNQALATLEEGKARLLAVALRLEGLQLAPAEQHRLGELRVQIREGEAAYEVAHGEEKAARIAALADLREELLKLADAGETAARREAGRDIVAFAGKVLPDRGALVAPIVGEAGGKIVLAVRNGGAARLTVTGVPQFTAARLAGLLGARDRDGWLGAYSINYLDGAEQTRRQSEWLDGIEKAGAELGSLLGEPLTEALAAQGLAPGSGAPVAVLPAGPLGLLPIGLARHPKTHRYLMEDYVVTLAPSLEALASAKARAGTATGAPSLTAIVNPTGDLPFTALEGALVESRFGEGRKLALAGTAATHGAVLAALKHRDYWHFSSHGYFDWDDPRASGLLLTGKIPITAGNLLDARDLGAPRLAVLSACETGLYGIATTPDEFVGLPATFLQLGAGGVVAALWPVSDLSTSLLIAKFYDFHLGEGLAPASALWKAQDWLRNASNEDLQSYVSTAVASGRLAKEVAQSVGMETRAARQRGDGGPSPAAAKPEAPFSHPYYWSGFTLTGL